MNLRTRLPVVAAVTVAVLVPFALLAALVAGNWRPLHDGDAAVSTALHDWALRHPGWVDVAGWVTNIFNPNPLRLAALILVVWLWRRGARGAALWVVTTMTAGGLLGLLLKLLIERHRPDFLDPVARAAGYSFPSGHALNAALAAGVFVLTFLPLVRRKWLLWTAGAAVAGLTGLSRIVLGVHWTSDVVAGWLLGVAVVAATTMAFTRRGPLHALAEGVDPALDPVAEQVDA
ncbi:phosphatase PAP2 family protein [Actinoplanes sp. N902-109]|uniref:phosphatase PAP2 family protein n=1 Tax=Actinoplanes sp. (strain N902-109) TaxID=649831 RepID=UPI0003295786|nr:phosphatase PAP2 family protein [Actinoplanes sp. N902-109]AGL15909.1 PA-phosphatase-like phosphoesterase [Actinoplanes sp. N902-109]